MRTRDKIWILLFAVTLSLGALIVMLWSDDPDWKLDYCNIEQLSPEEIRQRQAEFDRQKDVVRAIREGTGRVAAKNELAAQAAESSFG